MSMFRSFSMVTCLLSVILLTTDFAIADKGGKSGKGGGGNGKQGGVKVKHGGGNGNHGGGVHYGNHGNHGGHGHGNFGGNGRTYLSVSPNGVGFGYQDRNFGFQIGGVGGYGFYDRFDGYDRFYAPPYYSTPSFYSAPSYFSTPNYYSTPIYNSSPGYYPSYSGGSTYYPPTTGSVINPPLIGDERPLYPIAEPLPSADSMPRNIASAPSPVVEATKPPNIDRGTGTLIKVNDAATGFQAQAEEAFLSQNYEEAARIVKHALLEDPDNGKLHLFASQTRFAVGDYRGAAAGIAQAISLLDETDWGYVVENYRDFYSNSDYVAQMDRLVRFNRENKDVGYALMLRGYHYLFLGHEEAAEQQLNAADLVMPNDETTKKLLSLIVETLPPPDRIPAPRPAE